MKSLPSLSPCRFAGGLPRVVRFAAAVIGLSVASAVAAPIVIDDFTYQQGFAGGQSAATGTNLLYNVPTDTDIGALSFGGFTQRTGFSRYSVDPTNSVTFSDTFSSPGGGVGSGPDAAQPM